MAIYLVSMLPPRSIGLPGGFKSGPLMPLYLAFLPVGFAMPLSITRRAVGSYIKPVDPGPTFSPLPLKYRAVFFLWHFPWDYSHSVLRSTMPYGARTFLSRFYFEIPGFVRTGATILPASKLVLFIKKKYTPAI